MLPQYFHTSLSPFLFPRSSSIHPPHRNVHLKSLSTSKVDQGEVFFRALIGLFFFPCAPTVIGSRLSPDQVLSPSLSNFPPFDRPNSFVSTATSFPHFTRPAFSAQWVPLYEKTRRPFSFPALSSTKFSQVTTSPGWITLSPPPPVLPTCVIGTSTGRELPTPFTKR